MNRLKKHFLVQLLFWGFVCIAMTWVFIKIGLLK